MLLRGDKLNAVQRQMVLERFPYRWTKDNPHLKSVYKCPHCNLKEISFDRVECRQHHPTVPLISDQAWLASHAFYFIGDGSRLSRRHKHCEPVWMLAN